MQSGQTPATGRGLRRPEWKTRLSDEVDDTHRGVVMVFGDE